MIQVSPPIHASFGGHKLQQMELMPLWSPGTAKISTAKAAAAA